MAITLDFEVLKKESGIDIDKTTDGVWQEIQTIPGCTMKIAQMPNKKYDNYLDRTLRKKYRKQIQRGTLDDKIRDSYVCIGMSKHIIKDWKNMPGKNEDGESCSVPFSEEAALQLLQDESLSLIREEIVNHAIDENSYRLEYVEESKKNLESI